MAIHPENPIPNSSSSSAAAAAARPAAAMAAPRDWALLPTDVLHLILSHLTSFEILHPASAVCRSWRLAALDPHPWLRIDLRRPPKPLPASTLDSLARRALALSAGRLHDFRAEFFADDSLLSLIADTTSGLKSLTLRWPENVTSEGLVGFLRRCPFLEELEITSAFSPGEIGRASPGLKRFRLVKVFSSSEKKCNKDAMEIAESMRGLRELEMFGNAMGNKGLKAIVDGCKELEVLDIRGCYNLKVDDGVETEVLASVKTVKFPGPRPYR